MAKRSTPKVKDPPAGRYRIGMVARLTGLSTHTLRAWERRYGSITPRRMSGGARLYDDDDVARLRQLRELTEQGFAIGSIALLPPEELDRLASVPSPPQNTDGIAHAELFRSRFLDAIAAFDVDTAARLLTQIALVVTPRELVTDVLGPLFHELGLRWERGVLSAAHEHAASALLRSELGTLLRSLRVQRDGHTVLAATLPGEQHEFGALLAALTASAHGAHVIYLGSNLPIADIANTARAVRADLVLISIVNILDGARNDMLRELGEALPSRATLCVGGRGIPARPSLPRSVRHLSSLEELEKMLSRPDRGPRQ